MRGVHRGPGARRQGERRDADRDEVPPAAGTDQGRHLAAGEQGRDAGNGDALYRELKHDFNVFYDDKGAIGRRYRRQDEAGTPFCVTIDGETIQDDTVTIRDRDTPATAAGADRAGAGGDRQGADAAEAHFPGSAAVSAALAPHGQGVELSPQALDSLSKSGRDGLRSQGGYPLADARGSPGSLRLRLQHEHLLLLLRLELGRLLAAGQRVDDPQRLPLLLDQPGRLRLLRGGALHLDPIWRLARVELVGGREELLAVLVRAGDLVGRELHDRALDPLLRDRLTALLPGDDRVRAFQLRGARLLARSVLGRHRQREQPDRRRAEEPRDRSHGVAPRVS